MKWAGRWLLQGAVGIANDLSPWLTQLSLFLAMYLNRNCQISWGAAGLLSFLEKRTLALPLCKPWPPAGRSFRPRSAAIQPSGFAKNHYGPAGRFHNDRPNIRRRHCRPRIPDSPYYCRLTRIHRRIFPERTHRFQTSGIMPGPSA